MLGLRRWHINLLISAVGATFVVIFAYRLDAGPHSDFLDGFTSRVASDALLWPGWTLLGRPDYVSPQALCLANAVIYGCFFFLLMTIVGRTIDAIRGRHITDIERSDLRRYLR